MTPCVSGARLPCSWSRGNGPPRVLRIAAPWWCGPGRRSRALRLENGPCMSPTPSPSASMSCDNPRTRQFSRRLSSSAQEKDPRPLPDTSDHLASLQRTVNNPGSGTQEPVPRLRDRMQERARSHKHESAGRCAYHVQGARLLCKLRGKAGQYRTFAERREGFCTPVNQIVTIANRGFRLCSRLWRFR